MIPTTTTTTAAANKKLVGMQTLILIENQG